MTPNLGQGASLAIENAASLSNYIAFMLETTGTMNLSVEDIHWYLSTWASSRKSRTKAICLSSNIFTRFEALATWRHKMITIHVIPRLWDVVGDVASRVIVGAKRLNFLPLPERSLGGTTPFKNSVHKVYAPHRNQTIDSSAPEPVPKSFTLYLLEKFWN